MWVSVQRDSSNPAELASTSERLFKPFVIVVCGWSLIEAPLEFCSSNDSGCLLVLAASKVLMSLTGVATIINLRFAREVFAFICCASILATAPALPIEYKSCAAIALLSTVECIAKGACVAAFAIASLRSTWIYHQQELECQTTFLLRPRRAVDSLARQPRALPRLP